MHKLALATHKYGRRKTRLKTMTCSVVGARGYAGLETARLLLAHPNAKLSACYATSAFDLSKLVSSTKARKVACRLDSELLADLSTNQRADVYFLATPAEVSMDLAPKILAKGSMVIDLSGAFRLKSHDMTAVYGFEQSASAVLAQAQYGLSPWVGPASGVKMIANPGCYATAIEMALLPLLKAGLIDASSIVVDAKSGTTGAGKKASENLLFTEVEGECLPYKVGRHQHYPEIVEAIEQFAAVKIDAHMSTSLLPVRRGIIAAVYAKFAGGAGGGVGTQSAREAAVEAAFAKAYADYPLVSVGRADREAQLLQLKRVVGTARTHISYVVEGEKLYLFSCIDNLMKGAASQAIENLNRLSDLPVETGLGHLEAIT